jgi:hypothetical protein
MDSSFPVRVSSMQNEGELHVSKWIKHAFLIDNAEMEDLFQSLRPFFLIPATGVVQKDSLFVDPQEFLKRYREYLEWTKQSPGLPPQDLRRFFSLMFTVSMDCLYAAEVGAGRYVIKSILPVIMIQLHHFFISTLDQKIHPMVMSRESLCWGIQFSYPQVFEHPQTHEFSKVTVSSLFPNTAPFKTLIQWLRHHTMPTPLHFSGQRLYAPFRIGKQSLHWIHEHAGLKDRGIQVKEMLQKEL